MPFEIVRNDITNMRADAIVNTANPRPVIGSGTDARIHEKAGAELLAARQAIGPIRRGSAAATPAFGLQANYVIHTVGPRWMGGGAGEEALLRCCDEIRPGYFHRESCQETVPEAITAFLEGEDFEDVIRTAVSLGGDCDTLTCIAGSIAEGFYGVPEALKRECRSHLPQPLLDILLRFDEVARKGE